MICIRNSLWKTAPEPLEHSAYLDRELEVPGSLHKPWGNPYTRSMKAFVWKVTTPDCLLPSRVVLQHQAQAGTSPEVALCMASSLLSSCFHYSLSGFSWSEKSLNEMLEHHLRVCSGKPGTRQISTSYNYCLNKWDFIFCMRKNEARPSPYSIFKHQLKMD